MDLCGTCVCVRLRPPNARESGARCLAAAGPSAVAFTAPEAAAGGAAAGSSEFAFNKVYGERATQADVFADCRGLVQSVLAGYNATIMAYGQTGSGKTHTLIGDMTSPELRGVVPRAVEALGEGIGADEGGAEYEVRLTVVEIYRERVRDLLDPLGRDNLAIKQGRDGGTYVEGATEVCVTDEAQLVGVMEAGLAQRAVTATNMNAASSRSHCIVTVTVDKTDPASGASSSGKLRMVDLAGSERQDKTGATGVTLAEGALINKSLSCLANVVAALTDGGAGGGGGGGAGSHVPFRDSKLTRLLQDSLGGTARTVLIINCSPCADNAAESLSSLRFGSRALGIKNKVTANRRMSPEALQRQLAEAREQIEALQRQLAEAKSQQQPSSSSGAAHANEGAVNGSPQADGATTEDVMNSAVLAGAAQVCGSSSAGGVQGMQGRTAASEAWVLGMFVAAALLLAMALEDLIVSKAMFMV